MLEATGGSKVFATLMSSMAATAEKEDIRTFFFLEDVEADFEIYPCWDKKTMTTTTIVWTVHFSR
jgi:hypothetical protein